MANILVVDDSVSIQQLTSFTLNNAGHQISSASDGEEAFKRAQESQFDLIITDMNMTVMNGVELTAKLRETTQYKHTPILMLTTENQQDKKQEGKAAGVTGWIVKPFNPDALVKMVGKVIG